MNKETDSIRLIERFKLEVKEKGFIHHCLLEYLGISAGQTNQKTKKEEKSEKVFWTLKEKLTLTNKCEFREFLETISHLWRNHQQINVVNDVFTRL